ncbi:MAG: hypothetical protein RL701_2984 [Pseudomonadota bacterium]|jgi:hypothetical protein
MAVAGLITNLAYDASFERYELLSVLGEGGSGTVYEARDRTTGERVAVKELLRVNAATLARFKSEFRTVQELHHHNLVRLDALLEERGKWLIAMELVEGSDLLAHLYSADQAFNFYEPQLRDVFSQLAEALVALHSAGIVHRDLKPSNVRVTHEGRVVLLDFGLAIALDPDTQSAPASALGTIAYMAPEQATAGKVSPAADWYAFGVCLYEALTGYVPIDRESPFGLLASKQRSIPPRASEHVQGLPPDLDALCAALLSIDPTARPTGRSVMHTLQGLDTKLAETTPVRSHISTRSGSVFEGRASESAVLDAELARAQTTGLRMVLVEGDSGIGKSSLVEHFLASPRGAGREVLVLRSRCYENELLAYKAFDGAVDNLARALSRLPPLECAALLPAGAAMLCRLFPTLAEVSALVRAVPENMSADPSVQRIEAFALFAKLLARLSERHTIILAIDDLQWADPESFRLLHALLRSPHTTRCLIVTTVRPRAELEDDAVEGIAALMQHATVSSLKLSGLPAPDAHTLARALMGSRVPESWLESVVRESAGHPLFITVMARYAESQSLHSVAELTVDAAILALIDRLGRKAKRLLEVVALVGSPLAMQICARAAELDASGLSELVSELCKQKLLRRRGAGEIATFHDRIRRVTIASLPRDELRTLHSRIASTLAAHGDVDPAELARHHEAAGEFEPAYRAYLEAARNASEILAFGRAAQLFERALGAAVAIPAAIAEQNRLRIERGHALARAGQSERAARLYLEAAQHAFGEERTHLRIWAAQHLLQSAHVEEGMEAARALLGELGVPMPRGTAATIARLLWDRAYLRVSPAIPASLTRPAAAITLNDRMQLDALWNLAMPVSWIDPLASAALSTRHLRLTRAQPVPSHTTRALAEAAFAATIDNPSDPAATELLRQARELCDGTADPALKLYVTFREGAVATLRWDLVRARERFELALAIGTAQCPDQPWLLTNVRTTLGTAWVNLGDHARHAAAMSAWVAEAHERNDRFAIAMLETMGIGVQRFLMDDSVQAARVALSDAVAPWPQAPFSFVHFGEIISSSYIDLYCGGDHLLRMLGEKYEPNSGAFLFKTVFGRGTLLVLRAYGSLAALESVSGGRKRKLISQAKKDSAELQGLKSANATYEGAWLAVLVEAISGSRELARRKLMEVRGTAERYQDRRQLNALAYLEGSLEGGEVGRKLRESALRGFADQGWRNARRGLAIALPVLDSLTI